MHKGRGREKPTEGLLGASAPLLPLPIKDGYSTAVLAGRGTCTGSCGCGPGGHLITGFPAEYLETVPHPLSKEQPGQPWEETGGLPCFSALLSAYKGSYWDSDSSSLKETYMHVVKETMADPCWLI